MNLESYNGLSPSDLNAASDSDVFNQMCFQLLRERRFSYLYPAIDQKTRKILPFNFELLVYRHQRGSGILQLSAFWFAGDLATYNYFWDLYRPYKNLVQIKEILQNKYTLADIMDMARKYKETVFSYPDYLKTVKEFNDNFKLGT